MIQYRTFFKYQQEVTRTPVLIQLPTINIVTSTYTVGDAYLVGKVIGDSAYKVRLYVNYRRQQEVVLSSDGVFRLIALAILSPLDEVEIVVYNAAGDAIQRLTVTVNY